MGEGSNIWLDLAVVVLRTRTQEFIATSTGIRFPTKYVEEAKRKGFKTTTVGSVIARRNKDVDKADPHCFLTKGLLPRRLLVRNAVLAAVAQWNSTEEIEFITSPCKRTKVCGGKKKKKEKVDKVKKEKGQEQGKPNEKAKAMEWESQ